MYRRLSKVAMFACPTDPGFAGSPDPGANRPGRSARETGPLSRWGV